MSVEMTVHCRNLHICSLNYPGNRKKNFADNSRLYQPGKCMLNKVSETFLPVRKEPKKAVYLAA